MGIRFLKFACYSSKGRSLAEAKAALREIQIRQSCSFPAKRTVLNVAISTTNYFEVVALCKQWALERKAAKPLRSRYICVTSVHGIILARDDKQLASVLNDADIAAPDGMPVVWALRSFGHPLQQRVYGPTLMLEICASAAENGHRLFLYGGNSEILESLLANLKARFPEIQISGFYAPPFRPLTNEEDLDVRRRIKESDADIVLVGLGAPKQELWMNEHLYTCSGATLIGVGAAFDFHAGRKKQAPSWMQRNGLEWLFRLSTEPSRLWRRYLLTTPRFLPLWALQRFNLHR